MNTPLHFLLLCQSCRSLRNVSYSGDVLGSIKSVYRGWLIIMTSSEGSFSVLPWAPPTVNPPLVIRVYLVHNRLDFLNSR